MQGQHRVCRIAINALAATLILPLATAQAASVVIKLDHSTFAISIVGPTQLVPKDSIEIDVVNTDTSCFDYNDSASGAAPDRAFTASNSVVMHLTHQKGVTSYKVSVKLDPKAVGTETADQAKERCNKVVLALKEHDWTIPVSTLGWTIGFSGGLVVDGLTDRKYFLENASGQYIVRRDRDAQDKTNQRLALLLHLYNTSWFRDSDWQLVPLTVGIGVDDHTRYLVGTGVGFGEQWFVTGGAVFGKRATLPIGLSEGQNVSNQNAVTTLGQRTSASWFLSVSFAFAGSKTKDTISGLFGTATPKPGTN
jgi:hypothetical protein